MMSCNFTSAKSRFTIAAILRALEIRPMTAHELADELQLDYTTAWRYVTRLHSTPRRVYVKKWGESVNGGGKRRYFAVGSSPDAKEPRTPQSRARRPKVASTKKLSLPKRIVAHLEIYPYSTAVQIADSMDTDRRVMTTNLQRLKHKGVIKLSGEKGNRAWCWVLVTPPESRPDDKPIRIITRDWAPSAVEAQTPFSALFVVAKQGRQHGAN